MNLFNNGESELNKVEIRFFGQLKTLADEKGLSFPYFFELNKECSARNLAELLGVPTNEIEAVFINGVAKPIDEGWVKPGDRVGFIPYGVPGPYRVLLGFKKTEKQ